MTKQQRFATSLSPSKLCRLLIITFLFKLSVLALLIFEPGAGALTDWPFGEGGPATASAATSDSAAAPPKLEATLPDAGMDKVRPAPAQTLAAPPASSPMAEPGVTAPVTEPENRALPSIDTAAPSAASKAQQSAPAPTGGSVLAPDTADVLARKQEDLARKEQELRVLEKELADRLERMQLLENRLAEMIKDAEQAGDAKLRHLIDVLANMKAKQAAAVLETLDQKIAVRVLAGMRGRQAGEILTYVKPEIAAKLTEALARMQLPLR